MQLPDSMKHSQADLYLETYQVLDLEMSRLREIQRWQSSAASKVCHFKLLILPFYYVTLSCLVFHFTLLFYVLLSSNIDKKDEFEISVSIVPSQNTKGFRI